MPCSPAFLYSYLLPPVIFYAGLSVEKERFFQNLPSILSFGVVGTCMSAAVISAALYALTGAHLLRLQVRRHPGSWGMGAWLHLVCMSATHAHATELKPT